MTSSDDLERRLTLIQADPIASSVTTNQLTYYLKSASMKAVDFTNQPKDLGECWDGIIIDMALNKIIMAGAENSTSASEGGVNRTWSDIPQSLKSRLSSYRLVNGLHTSGGN